MPVAQRPTETLAEFRARRRQVQRRSDARHRQARLETRRKWKAAHPDLVAAGNHRQYERRRADPARREKRAADSSAYYWAHRDEVLAKQADRRCADHAFAERRRAAARRYSLEHRDAARARVKAWSIKNRERKNLNERVREGRRRAQAIAATDSTLTRAEWLAIQAAQLGLCCYCFRRRRLTLDHVTPISRGGAHVASNVAGACADCNRRKHNTTLIVWLARVATERSA
jgi:5-methylcytosine-specific restriction endonuclease McrA